MPAVVGVEGVAPGARGAGYPALEQLSIRTFRNIQRADLAFPTAGVAVVGENGHGKTNLLEAIYYLRLLRSMRGARDVDLVTFGADGFHLGADLARTGRRSVAVGFERASRRKKVVVDGAPPSRMSEALGAFPAVLFSPDDAAIVAGPPSGRRRFLDITLALTSSRYLGALERYRAALVRRNAALREHGVSKAAAAARAAVWEPALAESGAALTRARRTWLAEHASGYAELCASIGERAPAQMRLESALRAPDDKLEEALAAALEAQRPIDVARGLTHSGPHRDDLALTIGDRDIRTYGSAGQQRTAAIALRLLEAATLRRPTGSEPVVLLDDPFAELDVRRAGCILDLLDESWRGQTVLAVPRETDIPSTLRRLERWRIVDGEITTR
ncbi:MAG TPA: DNA replication and repair protein RecF [Gemmatimonadaceae bacterium]|nr:DNA replication and repair protein RecF [Gemmatimonadaceae bacterium]